MVVRRQTSPVHVDSKRSTQGGSRIAQESNKERKQCMEHQRMGERRQGKDINKMVGQGSVETGTEDEKMKSKRRLSGKRKRGSQE